MSDPLCILHKVDTAVKPRDWGGKGVVHATLTCGHEHGFSRDEWDEQVRDNFAKEVFCYACRDTTKDVVDAFVGRHVVRVEVRDRTRRVALRTGRCHTLSDDQFHAVLTAAQEKVSFPVLEGVQVVGEAKAPPVAAEPPRAKQRVVDVQEYEVPGSRFVSGAVGVKRVRLTLACDHSVEVEAGDQTRHALAMHRQGTLTSWECETCETETAVKVATEASVRDLDTEHALIAIGWWRGADDLWRPPGTTMRAKGCTTATAKAFSPVAEKLKEHRERLAARATVDRLKAKQEQRRKEARMRLGAKA